MIERNRHPLACRLIAAHGPSLVQTLATTGNIEPAGLPWKICPQINVNGSRPVDDGEPIASNLR